MSPSRKVWVHIFSLALFFFFKVSVQSQESERYMWVRGIEFVSVFI